MLLGTKLPGKPEMQEARKQKVLILLLGLKSTPGNWLSLRKNPGLFRGW